MRIDDIVLTKAIFTEKLLLDELNLTKDEAKSLVELFLGEIKDALERRVAVKL